MNNEQITLEVIDSHTAGEPTRILVGGDLPDLGTGSIAERRSIFREKYDHLRSAIVNEPRGSDVLVGGILCQPTDPSCVAAIIFFNNVDVLHMCGHGTIGLVETLAYQGKISTGKHKIETSVGIVTAELHEDGMITIANVESYRYKKDVPLETPSLGIIHGDIAWGGNWFFLVNDHGQELSLENADSLTRLSWEVRQSLNENVITGEDGGVIDHIEFFAESKSGADSQNFVLCPGKAYDRSPCGTGTSAKLACLIADGKIAAGDVWKQESIVGTIFQATTKSESKERIIPEITGRAFVTSESKLILQKEDPFCYGIRV